MSFNKQSVGYVYDPAMTLHESSTFHPECPDRIQRIYKALLENNLLNRMTAVKSREATFDELMLVHGEEYINSLEERLRGPPNIREQVEIQYGDIYTNEYSLLAAKLAAGSTLELVNAVAQNKLASGVAIVRPPGHHAGRYRAAGFCFYNNIAIAAKSIKKHVNRILIVDFDVHKGDGTEEVVENDSQILFFSVHRHDDGSFYPYTGDSSKRNNIINVGLNGFIGDDEYLTAIDKHLLPRLNDFVPDIILVSAGFDAIEQDPLGQSNVTVNGYKKMTQILKRICPKIVLVLEGGYHLQNMANAFVACTAVLLED